MSENHWSVSKSQDPHGHMVSESLPISCVNIPAPYFGDTSVSIAFLASDCTRFSSVKPSNHWENLLLKKRCRSCDKNQIPSKISQIHAKYWLSFNLIQPFCINISIQKLPTRVFSGLIPYVSFQASADSSIPIWPHLGAGKDLVI